MNELNEKLLDAAKDGNLDQVKSLIEQGADIEAKTDNGSTPLHWAAASGHTDVANLLLEKGADIEAKDRGGWTPLHWAAANGQTDIANLLLEKGADIDAKTNDGKTPLHLAAYKGHTAVAEMLIEKGADLDTKDCKGRTPLDCFAKDAPALNIQREKLSDLCGMHGAIGIVSREAWANLTFGEAQDYLDDAQKFLNTRLIDSAKGKNVISVAFDKMRRREMLDLLYQRSAFRTALSKTDNLIKKAFQELYDCLEDKRSAPATDLQRKVLRKLCESGETPSFRFSEWKNLTRGQACDRLAMIPDERLKEIKESLAPKQEIVPVADKGMER